MWSPHPRGTLSSCGQMLWAGEPLLTSGPCGFWLAQATVCSPGGNLLQGNVVGVRPPLLGSDPSLTWRRASRSFLGTPQKAQS